MDDELLGRQSAIAEARALCGMLQRGEETVESLRELIAVPARIERVLRAYALENPRDARWIEASLKFRVTVLEAFDHLVRDGLPVGLLEVEETDLGASTEAVVFAQP